LLPFIIEKPQCGNRGVIVLALAAMIDASLRLILMRRDLANIVLSMQDLKIEVVYPIDLIPLYAVGLSAVLCAIGVLAAIFFLRKLRVKVAE
jgi:hypothetical protein